eukprot:14942489-Alexandrium_andersonii.AAC.1
MHEKPRMRNPAPLHHDPQGPLPLSLGAAGTTIRGAKGRRRPTRTPQPRTPPPPPVVGAGQPPPIIGANPPPPPPPIIGADERGR